MGLKNYVRSPTAIKKNSVKPKLGKKGARSMDAKVKAGKRKV